jgi:tryptophan 2,3-dioxygenase
MNVYSDFAIPFSGRHVTVVFIEVHQQIELIFILIIHILRVKRGSKLSVHINESFRTTDLEGTNADWVLFTTLSVA